MEFSIVIPTFNRPERLKQCLQAISQMDFPKACFEVVVVDDGSPESMGPIVDEFKSQITTRFVRQSNAGPAAARNTGASMAQGHFLVFTDDDCRPDPQWLTSTKATIQDHPKALIGGHTINALPENVFSTASQLLIEYLYDYYNDRKQGRMFFASNNFAVPRELYQKLNGFDTTFPLAAGEDREFCDRWQHFQLPVIYNPDMQIHHAHTLTLGSFWKQHFNYGRGAFCFHQVRSKRDLEDMKVEPLSFYARLFAYPFRRGLGLRSLPLTGLLFLSQAANTAGFFWEKYHNKATQLQRA